MRYLQRQLLSNRQVINYGIAVSSGGEVVVNTTNNILVPKGTTGERPITSANGMVRYNTTLNELEVYQSGAWRKFRFKEPTAITWQSLGIGDGSTTTFGPITNIASAAASGVTWDVAQIAQNILVLVENVVQIPNTNYQVIQIGSDYYLQFTGPSINNKEIIVVKGFDQ